jgi:hypothetical protein
MLPLSTPFWEFHKIVIRETKIHEELIRLSTPFWEFQFKWTTKFRCGRKAAVAFYSLLGVSIC